MRGRKTSIGIVAENDGVQRFWNAIYDDVQFSLLWDHGLQ
jgi:hypothetical protein